VGFQSYRSGYAAYKGGFPFLDRAFDGTVMSPLDYQQCTGTMVFYAFALNLPSLPEWIRTSYAVDQSLVQSEAFWRTTQVLSSLYGVERDLGFDMKHVTCELVDDSPETANTWRDAYSSDPQTCKAGAVVNNARHLIPIGQAAQKYIDRVNFTQVTADVWAAELLSYTSQLPHVYVGVAKPLTRVQVPSFNALAKDYFGVLFAVHIMKISLLMSGDPNHFQTSAVMGSFGCNTTTVQTHIQATEDGGCETYKLLVVNHYDNSVSDVWEAYQPYDGTTVWLRSDRDNNFVPEDGGYTINHHAPNPDHRITMSPGKNYTIHVPTSHPVAFLVGTTQAEIDSILTVDGTIAGTETPTDDPLPQPGYGAVQFYSGQLNVSIHADAPTIATASLYCYHHGWMGRKDQLAIRPA
jgi:hypothetical protein